MKTIVKREVDATYWRSMDQLADTPEYQEFLQREFPSGASEMLDPVTRRNFMKIMGASVALAGMASCRNPKEAIVPFVKSPENVIPGKAKFYASTMTFADHTFGVLVESHEGRPTKIEGNDLYPSSQGATHPWALASVLSLYDQDRSKAPSNKGGPASWNEFEQDWRTWSQNHAANKGTGLAVIAESFNSPAVEKLAEEFKKQFPNATWVTYEPVSQENVVQGIHTLSGKSARPMYHLNKASIIVSIDSDFLGSDPDCLRMTKDFSKRRRQLNAKDEMNRLYAIESNMTSTGAMADHRLALESSKIPQFLVSLYKELGLGSLPAKFQGITGHDEWIKALAKDLKKNKGKSVLIAGAHQSALTHGLVSLINQAVASNSLVSYHAVSDSYSNLADLKKLSAQISKKQISTLVMLGGNPVFNTPADLDFANGIKNVERTVHVSPYVDETSSMSTWHLPVSHYLESWSDAQNADGTLSIVQPLIQPLYDSKSMLEILNMLVNKTQRSGYDIVVESWKGKNWKQTLHDGVLKGSSSVAVSLSASNLVSMEAPKANEDIEVVFQPSPSVFDGRFANNGWLQEVSQPITKITWDNPALISPALAKKFGLKNGSWIQLKNGNRSLEIPVFIQPGQAKNSITLMLGYGRTFGTVAKGQGFNTYTLRSSSNPDIETGFTVTALSKGAYKIASTQNHGSMEGRPLVREATKEHFEHHPDFTKHMVEHPPLKSLWKEHEYTEGYQWGMVIDLNTCTGCNSCVTSCQSENNIPIVGKDQVERGRAMHWIRIDRYFSGSEDTPLVVHQPVPCMHCENAPCEQVCPVNATVHDKEGLNVMTYNRCIGTRYCSNNCPYKVRRFNFFNYTKDTPQVQQMAANPDVTVRFRGVMEKCTYCVQRINSVRSTAKLDNNREIRDGEIKTACQQACPAEAITFGNINDPKSAVSQLKKLDHNYSMLEELNVKPRTTYLAKIRNLNPELKGNV